MSQAIGSLFISLGLDTAAFSAGVKQAQGRVGKFASDLSNKLGKIGDIPGIKSLQASLISISRVGPAAFGAMAGAAAIGAAAMSVSAMNAAKEINNMSRIANATPEEFQRWGYAAEQVGISQEKMGDILKDVNDRVGDFIATGGGPMKDFFERIAPKVGVTAEQFRKLSGPQALQLYVSSLEKANVNQQDFTFFMEAMASDSTALVPLLKNGGKAAQAYGDRLAALGGVMGNETVARLSKMRSALSEIAVVMGGVRNTIGAAFAPVITSLATAFVSLMTKGSGLRMVFDGLAHLAGVIANAFAATVNIISHLVAAIWNGLGALASWINQTTGIGSVLSTIWDAVGGMVLKLIIGISNLLDATGGLGGAFTLLGEVARGVFEGMVSSAAAIPIGLAAVWEVVKSDFLFMIKNLMTDWAGFLAAVGLDAMAADADKTATAFFKKSNDALVEGQRLGEEAAAIVVEGFGKAGEALSRLNVQVAETKSATDGATLGSGAGAGLDQLGEKAKGAKEKVSALQKVMKDLAEEAAKLKATMGMSDLDASIWETQREAGVSANSANGQIIAAQMKQINGMKTLKAATDEWKQSISSAMSEFITKGGSFKNVLSQIIGKLAEMVFNKGFDALWGGAGGSKGLSGLAGGVLKFFGFANGTNNAPGGPAWVHERGGELINLPQGSQVIPHDISKRMADTAARNAGGAGGRLSIGWDQSIGNFMATMYDVAGRVVQQATPSIQSGAVKKTARASHRSKAVMGI